MNDPISKKRLYGRRSGRPLNPARQAALDTLYPILSVPDDSVKEDKTLDPALLFNTEKTNISLEIGFGNGERLAHVTQHYPDQGFIGCEPFINGVAYLLKSVQETQHDNLRVFMDDAVKLVDSLTDSSIDDIYVLNPDPWPKTRHHKRRIINHQNLTRFSRILKPNGKLVMTTDVDDLAEWMVTEASNHPDFEWTTNSQKDWKIAPDNWVTTRYEKKGAAAGRHQSYLIFHKTKL